LLERICHLGNSKEQIEGQIAELQQQEREWCGKIAQLKTSYSQLHRRKRKYPRDSITEWSRRENHSENYETRELIGDNGSSQSSNQNSIRQQVNIRRLGHQAQALRNEIARLSTNQNLMSQKCLEVNQRLDALRKEEINLIGQGRQLSTRILSLHKKRDDLQTKVDELTVTRPNNVPEVEHTPTTTPQNLARNGEEVEAEEYNSIQRKRRHRISSESLHPKRRKYNAVEFWKLAKTWQVDKRVGTTEAELIFKDYCRKGYAILDCEMQVLNLPSYLALVEKGTFTIFVVSGWELKDLPPLVKNTEPT
jgi:chromosome segregation ATPase